MAARGDLAKRILEKANRRRSPLYLWLQANYSDIARAMSRPRPSWTALAETAVEAGQVDDKGKPPNANSVRAAWLRVSRDRDKRRSKGRQGKEPSASDRLARPRPGIPAPASSLAPADVLEPSEELPPRLTFRPARIR